MKNARKIKTIALNLFSDAIGRLDLTVNDVVAGNVEISDEEKTEVVRLFKSYQSQALDRAEAKADTSAKKLADRVKAQEGKKAKDEKRRTAIAERQAAKDARKAKKLADKEAKAAKEAKAKNGKKTNSSRAKAATPELAAA